MSSSQWKSAPREFPVSGFNLLDSSQEIEEETLPTYQPEKYYPVRLGEVLGDRYQILAKLGYGVASTVWLARDLRESRYVVLKVCVKTAQNHELKIYDRINASSSTHPGKRFIRKLLDHFSIEGPHGRHTCLVHEPMGISAGDLAQLLPGQAMTIKDMKPCIRQLLIILDFLHSVTNIIHTDLQLKNLLLPSPTEDTLLAFEERQLQSPPARKVLHNRTIYTSSRFPLSDGIPLLSDFGEARFGDEQHSEDIMPNAYRAPEVILKMNWDYNVDIWNVAMVAWSLVSPNALVDGRNSDGVFDDRAHLAELVALLGPPPAEFREMSTLSPVFWDSTGNWKGLAPIPDVSFEGLVANAQGEDEDKQEFVRWLRAALQWNPKDRPTALELLYDEWMMKGLKLGNAKARAKVDVSSESPTKDVM